MNVTFLLFISLLLTESLIMVALHTLGIDSRYFWLSAFIDATGVALVGSSMIYFFLSRDRITPRPPLTPEGLIFQSALLIFCIESMLMLIFPLFEISRHTSALVILNSIVFASISTLLIKLFLLKKMDVDEPDDINEIEPKHPKRTLAINLTGTYVFSISLLILFLVNVYQQQQQNRIDQIITQQQLKLELLRESIQLQVSQSYLDIQILARDTNLQQGLEGDQPSIAELQQNYLSIATIKPEYEQIRFIDSNGEEKVRVNQSETGPYIVKTENLQNKSERYYFTEAFKLSEGDIYISPMDLNIEHGQIELPFKPIIRTATPVFDRVGNKRGVVVINMNASLLLGLLDQPAVGMTGELMLLNDEGYWLYGQDLETAWAFMFPELKDMTIAKIHPDEWPLIKGQNSGALKTGKGVFIFDTIDTGFKLNKAHQLSSNWPVWKLAIHITPEELNGQINSILKLLMIFFFIMATVTAIGSLMFYRVQLKNIQADEKIHHLAYHDPLTGLSNRRLFIQMLELELSHVRRNQNDIAVMYIDLDNFKPVNDRFGHKTGDIALKEIAYRLSSVLRESDTLARLGGDEFAVILPSPGSQKEIIQVAERVLEALARPFIYESTELSITASIGVAQHFPGQPLESLLHEADRAMYQSKRRGRNCYSFA